MLLRELTTKHNNQVDHILGKCKQDIKIFTTAFKNLATDHKVIVIRISKPRAEYIKEERLNHYLRIWTPDEDRNIGDENEIEAINIIRNNIHVGNSQKKEVTIKRASLEPVLIREDTVSADDIVAVQLKPITPFMQHVIDEILQDVGRRLPLVEQFNISITRRDIETLDGLNWLNDQIVNFYMKMIVRRSRQEDFPDVWAFSTFFYPKLLNDHEGHKGVKRWTKKVDLFAQSLVFIPVHIGMHWSLALADIDKQEIKYYDSMGDNNEKCLNVLETYLSEEYRLKKGRTMKWKKILVKGIPQQLNGSDCGMFLCKYSEYLSRRAQITFSQENMPFFRRRMIFEIVKIMLHFP